MTVANWSQAKDEICELVQAAWVALLPSLAPIKHEKKLRFENTRQTVPAGNSLWARVDLMPATERQASLSVAVGEPGSRRYEIGGVGQVAISWPQSEFAYSTYAEQIAHKIKSALRGKKTLNGVWFEEVRITESKNEENFYFVIFNFKFNEVG